MQKYQDVVLKTNGDIVPNATVLVKLYPSGTTATIYSDDGITTKANPLTVDGLGSYSFYAANDRYQLVISNGGFVTKTVTDVILFDSANSSSSSGLGFLPAGVGAVATNVQEKNRRYVDAFDFFTTAQIADVVVRTGAVDIRTPLNAALLAAYTSGQKAIRLPAGKYYCGTHGTADVMFDLSTYGDDFSIITDGIVEFVCQTTANVIPTFFKVLNNNRFKCGHIRFRDTGYSAVVDWKGAQGFLINSTGTAYQDILIDSVSSKNMVASVTVQGTYTNRIKNINIGAIFSDDCYYGINCQNQGDNVKVGAIYAYQNIRPIFVYGISGFEATVYNNHNRSTSGPINISRSVGGYNTKAINIRYVARDMVDTVRHVLINHVDLLGGTISDVNVDVDVESSVGYYPVYFVNYDGAGNETAAASSNIVRDVTVTGTADSNALAVATVAAYSTTTGRVNFSESTYLTVATNTYAALDVRLLNATIPTANFTPTIVGTTIAGAGTYTAQIGRQTKIGSRVFFDVTLTISAHTGTGNMTVSLNDIPYTPKNVNAAHGWNCVAIYSNLVVAAGKEIGAQLQNNSKTINLYAQDPAGGAVALVAMDTACSIYISGSYEV